MWGKQRQNANSLVIQKKKIYVPVTKGEEPWGFLFTLFLVRSVCKVTDSHLVNQKE